MSHSDLTELPVWHLVRQGNQAVGRENARVLELLWGRGQVHVREWQTWTSR